MRRPLRFAVADLPEGAKTVELEESAERLDLHLSDDDLHLVTPVRVVATMIRSGKGVIGEGHAVSVGRFMCGRCLADFRLPLRGTFDVTFRPAAKDEPVAEREIGDQDVALETYAGDALDLTELVREGLLLAIPPKPICRPECKGLCATCGKDLNAGPCACPKVEGRRAFQGLAYPDPPPEKQS